MLWLICCVVDTDAPKISTYRNNTVLHSSDSGVADLLHTKKAHIGKTEWCIVMMLLWLICCEVDTDTPGISTHGDKWIQMHQNLAHTGTQQCTILTILWPNCCTPKKAQIGTQWCTVLTMLWPICCNQDKSTHPKKAHMGTALQCRMLMML